MKLLSVVLSALLLPEFIYAQTCKCTGSLDVPKLTGACIQCISGTWPAICDTSCCPVVLDMIKTDPCFTNYVDDMKKTPAGASIDPIITTATNKCRSALGPRCVDTTSVSPSVTVVVSSLGTYPGYSGPAIVGGAGLRFQGTSVEITYQMSGTPTECLDGPSRMANSCGIHIHAGMSCADAKGHYFNKAYDPWTDAVYSGPQGSVTVEYGADFTATEGRVLVVHDYDGVRVTCAVIKSEKPPVKCNEVMCMMYCEQGFEKGADGCDICKCVEKPPVKCNEVMCMMYCEKGFQKGADGCDICKCVDDVPEVSAGSDVCKTETAALMARIKLLQANFACKKNMDCLDIGYCSMNEGKCKALRTKGEKCNVVQRCVSGLTCQGKNCQ